MDRKEELSMAWRLEPSHLPFALPVDCSCHTWYKGGLSLTPVAATSSGSVDGGLQELEERFETEEACGEFLARLRWPQAVRRQNNSHKTAVLLRDDFQVIPLQSPSSRSGVRPECDA